MSKMEKIIKMNADLLAARKAGKDGILAKNLLSTLKGQYELDIKGSSPEGNETLEKIVKKMIKSAEQVGTEDALAEIAILKVYMPQMLSEEETRALVVMTMADNIKLVESNNIGALMGMVMKSGKKVDGKMVKNIIAEEINEIQA
jgi:uncharacterized protein YqeY